MNNLGAMTALVQVIEAGGFSAAARRMRVSVSVLSRQVMQLEDRLGARLLQRTTRRIALTEEGRAYFERARRILADIAETELAVQSAHAAPSGTLRINMSIAFGRSQVVPLLPEFLERYPDVGVELTFTDAIVDLIEDGADVAIRIANLSDSRLVARRLADNRRLICAAPSYIARFGEPRTPGELAQHNCLVSTVAPQLNAWEFETEGGIERIAVNGNVGGNVSETLYQLCLAGVGIMRLAEFLVGPDVKAGRLVPLLTRYRQPTSPPIWAVYPERRHLSPKVRVFVDFLVAKFAPTPPWQCNFPL